MPLRRFRGQEGAAGDQDLRQPGHELAVRHLRVQKPGSKSVIVYQFEGGFELPTFTF